MAVGIGSLDDFDDLVGRATEESFRFVDPLVLGTYFNQCEELSGDFTETMGAIQSGLNPNPADIHQIHKLRGIYNLWGRVLLAQGDYEQTIEKARRAIALDPEYGPAYQTWEEVFFAQARYRDVIEMCQLAIEHDPNASRTYRMWGDALYFLGHVAEVQTAYDISTRLEPATAQAYFARGDLYLPSGGLGGRPEGVRTWVCVRAGQRKASVSPRADPDTPRPGRCRLRMPVRRPAWLEWPDFQERNSTSMMMAR